MIGPVVKIDPADLPRRAEHPLPRRRRRYDELPRYIAGWDVALLPFARNEATRFISPTKTPEYLAAGKPVVSTSIRDVVTPYGEHGPGAHRRHRRRSSSRRASRRWPSRAEPRRARADAFLRGMSWDAPGAQIGALLDAAPQPHPSTPRRRRRRSPVVALGA